MSCSTDVCTVKAYYKQSLHIVIAIAEPSVDEHGEPVMVAVDVSAATLKQITLRKPDDTLIVKTASFEDDGVDGEISCDVTGGPSGELDVVSDDWVIQGIVIVGGKTYPIEPIYLEVLATNWSVSGTTVPS